ncbi:MAG: class I SAM-dependent methyltransferase [Parvularculaceae bacterium]|nr:class I SAM-dependent methyltransferase [Parvularculaceae bacterium]
MVDRPEPAALRGDVFEREETVAAWDDDYYHPLAARYYDRALPDMLTAMGVRPGDLVLDAGCGPGVHSIRAARFGAKVKAIDVSSVMLAHARARAERAGVSAMIDFAKDDLTKLSLEPGAFSFIFSWGVLIHVPDAMSALDHLARSAAPGGKLALHILAKDSLDDMIEQGLRRLLRKPLKNLEETPLGRGNWYDFNGERLWVQRFDIGKLERVMAERDLRLVGRRGAEFSEFQRRAPKLLRPLLLLANRLAYDLRLPAALFCTQIVIFEKPPERRNRIDGSAP